MGCKVRIMGMENLTILTFSMFIFIFIANLFLRRRSDHRNKKKKFPPSPRKLPIIGNLHQLGPLPHRAFKSLSDKYGELMLLHLGSLPVLIVSSPEAACEILKHQELVFSNRPNLGILKMSKMGARDLIFAPYGKFWREMKTICVQNLLSSKKVQSSHGVRRQETSLMIRKLKALEVSSANVNLSEMIAVLMYDVICRLTLGRKYEDGDKRGERLKKLVWELVDIAGSTNVGDLIPWLGWINKINGFNSRVEKTVEGLDEFLDGFLEEAKEKKKKKKNISSCLTQEEEPCSNFVDIMLDIQREKRENNDLQIDDEAIKATFVDMFSAGMHTTSVALEWTMTELLRNSAVMNVLQKEVRGTVNKSDNKEEITEDDIEKMTYLKAVIKESLRIHPPDPLLVPRESTKNTKIMGYDVDAGTCVMINAWAISNDPLVWKNPRQFMPERFLNGEASAGGIDFKGLHFELIPFGSGRRGCPGLGYAVSVVELALAKLVYHFDFSLPNGEPDMDEESGITVHKRTPLVVAVTSCF